MKAAPFTIHIKLKDRKRFAPATKKINSKKIYRRNNRVDSND